MNYEKGSITIWALGLSLLLFGFGFLTLDLWSGFSTRLEAAAIADGAAIAGATALDETAWRSGSLALDPATAESRATTTALAHPRWRPDMTVSAQATPAGITVYVTQTIRFRFIASLVPGQATEVTVSGYAEPEIRGLP